MFTFNPNGDEFVFGTPTTSQAAHQIQDDLIADYTNMDSTLISFAATGDGRQLRETMIFEPSLPRQIESNNECSVKKVMHREVERKRRQEMSALYASLGSLLPVSQTEKGRCSVNDKIQEAVDYIKQTEKNIERLSIRRDKLKKSLGLSNPKCSSSCADDGFVSVNLIADGVEILVSTSDSHLSPLLAVLAQKKLDVVSCVSTRMNGRLFHNIKIEAADMTSLDLSELQARLSYAIK